MKKAYLGLVMGLAFMLSSCDEVGNKGADGYRFIEAEYEQTELEVEVVLYNSVDELQDALADYYRENDLRNDFVNGDITGVQAFSELTTDGKSCRIHMIRPDKQYVPEFIGHEFTHCVFGQWHRDNATL